MDGNRLNIAPEPDEIEISVFGPGYGESILLHLGGNNWFIIDSCIDPLTQEPAPLIYLQEININPSVSIRQVIATHWHDDHVRGLGKILKSCTSAEFVCSDALRPEEFNELVASYGVRTMMKSSGVDEFREVMEVLQQRKSQLGKRYITPIFASSNRHLWHGLLNSSEMNYECSIYALSPSDASILAARLDIENLLPKEETPKRRLLAITPNRAAVVLWVSAGHFNILFGSDLEESEDPQTGWSVIINSANRPSGKASFFKIPHHGSKSAHHPAVWTEMLEREPIAVLTPYEKGNNRLPTKQDINRMCALTSNAYTTADPLKRRAIRRDKTVEKTIKETVRNIRQVNPSIGHVRLRAKQQSAWNIELFGDAISLIGLMKRYN